VFQAAIAGSPLSFSGFLKKTEEKPEIVAV